MNISKKKFISLNEKRTSQTKKSKLSAEKLPFYLNRQKNFENKRKFTAREMRANQIVYVTIKTRGLTRLTNGFSKKRKNLNYALALFFAYYNFCRSHKSLDNVTPAMAAGISKSI
jgi:hypothetical protein